MRAPNEYQYKCKGVSDKLNRKEYLNVSQLFDYELHVINETPIQHIEIEVKECYKRILPMAYVVLYLPENVYKLNIIDYKNKLKFNSEDKLLLKEVISSIKKEAEVILRTVYDLSFTKDL